MNRKRTGLTLAMVETNNMMTVAMWTTKILASNTSILAFRWLEGEESSENKGEHKRKRRGYLSFNVLFQLSHMGGLSAKTKRSCSKNHHDSINSCQHLIS